MQVHESHLKKKGNRLVKNDVRYVVVTDELHFKPIDRGCLVRLPASCYRGTGIDLDKSN